MRVCRLTHRNWFPRVPVSSTVIIGRDSLDLPRMLREPTHVFTMPAPGPDLFAQGDEFIGKVFTIMNEQVQHEFQVTTRHIDRAHRLADKVSWGPNIWLGVAIGDAPVGDSIALLRDTPAQVRFALIKGGDAVPAFDVSGLNFVVVENVVEPEGLDQLEVGCEQAGVRLFFGPRVMDAELRAPTSRSTELAASPIARARRR